MGMHDYCAAGHWDEDGLHTCTLEDGMTEQLRDFGFAVVTNGVLGEGVFIPVFTTYVLDESRYSGTYARKQVQENLQYIETGHFGWDSTNLFSFIDEITPEVKEMDYDQQAWENLPEGR